MSHKWIRKDDKVVVIAGNDKGVSGTVVARKGDRIIVKGVNVRKRHTKAQSQDRPSEIIEIEKAIHISNVSYADEDGKPIKVKSKLDGKSKVIVFANDESKVLRTLKK